MKENQTSQVNEFSAFLCMRRWKSLGSLKSFLWYVRQLSGASILCFPILRLLRVHRFGGGLQWPMAWWQASCFHPECPQGSLLGATVKWWLEGCNILCLLIWQVIFFTHIFFVVLPEAAIMIWLPSSCGPKSSTLATHTGVQFETPHYIQL